MTTNPQRGSSRNICLDTMTKDRSNNPGAGPGRRAVPGLGDGRQRLRTLGRPAAGPGGAGTGLCAGGARPRKGLIGLEAADWQRCSADTSGSGSGERSSGTRHHLLRGCARCCFGGPARTRTPGPPRSFPMPIWVLGLLQSKNGDVKLPPSSNKE